MKILNCINRLQALYIKSKPADEVFNSLLTDILNLTNSQFGFINELKYDETGGQYLQALAMTNITWDDASRRFWEDNYSSGLKFYATDSLYFATVITNAPVIANDPAHDSHSCGRMPPGHPALDCFLGLCLYCEDEIIGCLGMANRPDGYDEALVKNLQPVLAACAQIVEGYRSEMRQLAAEAKLQEKSVLLENMINSSADYILAKDANLNTILCNETFAQAIGKKPTDLYGKTDQENGLARYKQSDEHSDLAVLSGKIMHNTNHIYHSDGSLRIFDSVKVPLRSADDKIIGLLEVNRDITEKKALEEKLQLAASVFTNTLEGIMILSSDGTILDINKAFSRITGYELDDIVGKNMRILNAGLQDNNFFETVWYNLNTKGHWYGEVWNRRKNGEVYAVMQSINTVSDEHQTSARKYVSLLSDITMIKEHENELEHIAHYDALTSLPNRLLLADRLYQGIAQSRRRGEQLAVIYIDLDGFKSINDNYGHEAGDQLLIAAAQRMKQALRDGDTLARIGGDEFVAILLDIGTIEASVPILSRILMAASRPVHFNQYTLQVSASLGVTFYASTDNTNIDQLLHQADLAMYQAKLAGKNNYHFFDVVQDSHIRGHHESLERIRQALIAHEFVLYYQPKVNMQTAAIIGVEALIRWQHPSKGLLPPNIFMPIIADNPLAIDLGEWVIDTVLTQMERWTAAGLTIPVSINIDARQLQHSGFLESLRTFLAAHPTVNPASLELEVLEISAMEDLSKVSKVLEISKEMGFKFALDNFGTGYSSLTYLKRLPVTILKIDQSFVRDIIKDPNDQAIVKGLLGLAPAFDLKVIAVGVETIEHGTLLRQLGCDLAQGYGIALPMPANELPDWCLSWKPDPVWANIPSINATRPN
ncbi:EAL domain-containing protein [Methylobacter sp. S3L5C]|uniref:EAL domain-containing protein n=1 Tax=Methylobacter sp. S3L5C TaxID=2839024 RepID=UPI001FAB52CF|nr:EAL domain-containing protein [Methylobacter sp. S3L5C]UOA08213.1 EAL domain-containing protein [Methylobacter sp. S3L5C]